MRIYIYIYIGKYIFIVYKYILYYIIIYIIYIFIVYIYLWEYNSMYLDKEENI